MKYKLKDRVDPKGVVTYRVNKDGESKGFKKVVLGDANQTQLGHLHAIGHPFVEEEVKASAGK